MGHCRSCGTKTYENEPMCHRCLEGFHREHGITENFCKNCHARINLNQSFCCETCELEWKYRREQRVNKVREDIAKKRECI